MSASELLAVKALDEAIDGVVDRASELLSVAKKHGEGFYVPATSMDALASAINAWSAASDTWIAALLKSRELGGVTKVADVSPPRALQLRAEPLVVDNRCPECNEYDPECDCAGDVSPRAAGGVG